MNRPELVTFDVYMALLDIQGSLVPPVVNRFNLSDSDASTFVQLWRNKQMERAASSNSLGLQRTPFRDATRLGLDYALWRFGCTASAAEHAELVQAWDTLTPWPEADAAIAAVKAKGLAVGILSNGDQDMLEAVACGFTTEFDHILSAETAGHYKPHPAVYALPTQRLGVAMEKVLHVAGSPNDVLGAIACGMVCAWSNRTGDVLLDPAYPPTYMLSSLAEVADLV